MLEVGNYPDHRDQWSAARRGEPVDWDALFEGFKASVDWPACDFWEELSEHYPESKVLLSVRDPERWYASIRNTIHLSTSSGLTAEDETERERAKWANSLIWEANFDDRMEDKDHVIGVYEAHTEKVKATIPPDRLLVYETGSGWGPLCEFFDVPVPDDPYPHVNTTEEFRERFGRRGR